MDYFRSLFYCCPMGTSAFRGEYSVVLQSRNTKWSRMSCEECNVKFTLIRRKRTCSECGHYYCGNCLKKSKGMEGSTRCYRCRIFCSVPLDRQSVSELKVRDLRWFLESNKIPTEGCKEKVDLVDLVMHHAALRNASLSYPQNYERHTVRPEVADDIRVESTEGSPVFKPTQQSAHFSQTPSNPPNPLDSENLLVYESEEDGFTVIHVEEEDERLQNESDDLPTQSDVVQTESEVIGRNEETMSNELDRNSEHENESDKPNAEGPMFPTLSINDITSADQISTLTVMQLKLILTRNFVGFKGCCEKQELQEKVRHLWKKKQESKNIDAIADENLCKICMEAAIDSVLLDCGHLVSCTECGKRLNECPICRQYVVRVVHTFKA